MNTIHLICNPISGKGSSKEALNKIKDWAKFQKNLDLKIYVTENEGHAIAITKEITKSNNERHVIIAIGGDGTLNEILNGIVNFNNTYLGILPYGSGNDFAAALKINASNPIATINFYINHATSKKVDFLILNDKYRVLNGVGLGCSAEVITYRNKMRHFSPKIQYRISSLRKGLFWKAYDYRMIVENKAPQQITSMWITMNNGISVGGGLKVAPTSSVNDGQITVSYLKPFCHLTTISKFSKILKGKIAKIKQNYQFNCKEISLELSDNNIEYDGNILEHQTLCNVKIVPNKLNILIDAEK